MPEKKRALLAGSLLESMTAVQERLEGKVGDYAKSQVKTKASRENEKARRQSAEGVEAEI
jgi:hypothetical protein